MNFEMDDNYMQFDDFDGEEDYDYEAPDDLELASLNQAHVPLDSIYVDCAIPVIGQFLLMCLPSIFFCLFYRQIVYFFGNGRPSFFHGCSTIFGGLVLYYLVDGITTIQAIIFALLSYWLIYAANKRRSPRTFLHCVIILLCFMISMEYLPFLKSSVPWNRVRSIYMIMVMKILSLVYELSYDKRAIPPSVISFTGYLFFPGSLVFGPWIAFDTYLDTSNLEKIKGIPLTWLETFMESMRSLFCLTSCLVMSSCGLYWVFSGQDSKWMSMTETAMSVRFSHYFVSITAEVLSLLSGVWLFQDGGILRVTHLPSIELPRSLVEVVMYWNLPMHLFLKKFVHAPLSHLGSGPAALLTFAISAMLHGLNFPVTAVLLSLAIYAYIEYEFRKVLAKITSSCIGVRECRQCNHRNKSGRLVVRLANFFFTVLTLFHLNYLGVMLDSANQMDEPVEPTTPMWRSQLDKWRHLDFVSHKIVLLTAGLLVGIRLLRAMFSRT